ncbi:FtsX-like permease family protein [Paenibacillus sp.]|uniref:FtsX-like permease family protein n=1 Tax=Paenibacillus sp. TaxID=58172 RepID=UPI0028124F4E|nr:FtsX-like permease family protein [Paenibacillus sp.]
MTLFELAKKNIKGNFRNYFIYFLSMFASVAIFYVFASLQYSTQVIKAVESSKSMQSVFMVGSIVLLLFVSVFMMYSSQFFARKRKKEAGLYALLGVPKQTIGQLLFYENMIIGAGVLALGIAAGTVLSKLFAMILMRLLGVAADIGFTFSLPALLSTVVVFLALITINSIQAYRLVYRFKLIELFRAEQEGEQEPRASAVSGIAAVALLVVGYSFGLRDFENNGQIVTNLGVMTVGIIAGTSLLFSSFMIFLLKLAKRHKRRYYKGMNLIIVSNLVYRMRGNAHTLSVISILSAVALCAFSFGFGTYYGYEQTARLTAPFSFMHIAQDERFDRKVEEIIRGDEAHPVEAKLTIPVVNLNGEASSADILSDREREADERPVKAISVSAYNRVAETLRLDRLTLLQPDQTIAIRPMYTDYEREDFEGETITLQLPDERVALHFVGMTIERVLNWHYPDVMIVVADDTFHAMEARVPAVHYVGYVVKDQKTTKATADSLAALQTPASKLSTYYAVYRLGIENAAFNVFILGFLGVMFLMATGSILYFKQLTEAANDRHRYEILRKIGASKKEIAAAILKQNAWIFALPLLIGLGHYFIVFNWLRKLFGGMGGIDLMLPVLVCVAAFMAIYLAYYLITVSSIHKMIDGESARTVRLPMFAAAAAMVAAVIFYVWTEPPARYDEPHLGERIHLTLPEPTGDMPVGVTELHLSDPDRSDPWLKGRTRELMISIWYPAAREGGRKAPYMPPRAAAYYDDTVMPTIGVDPGRIELSGIGTHAWLNAPAASGERGWPVILYSPGGSVPRSLGTINVQELASRGYVVVTIDHTYEATVVEFPDGRIETEQLPAFGAETVLQMVKVRVDDVRYVLDRLTGLKEGPKNASLELPEGLKQALDLSGIGIFGHSAGGATAAQAMYEDDRIDAGIDMDGTMGYLPDHLLPVARQGLDRPFLLMNAGSNDEGEVDSHLTAEDRASFWNHSSGWKLDVVLPSGAHYTFTDQQYLLPQLSSKLSLSPRVVQGSVGTVDPEQALAAQRDYIAAFFDLHLKGMQQPMLESPFSPYAEVNVLK